MKILLQVWSLLLLAITVQSCEYNNYNNHFNYSSFICTFYYFFPINFLNKTNIFYISGDPCKHAQYCFECGGVYVQETDTAYFLLKYGFQYDWAQEKCKILGGNLWEPGVIVPRFGPEINVFSSKKSSEQLLDYCCFKSF